MTKKEYDKIYYQKNREKIRERSQNYFYENREEILDYQRKNRVRSIYKRGTHPNTLANLLKGGSDGKHPNSLKNLTYRIPKGYALFKGRKHTEESKLKMSITKLQKNGRTEPLKQDYRNDSFYRFWSRRVKKRDKNVCQLKDKSCFGYNIIHHIKSWTSYRESRYDVNNGIVLCQYHHPRKREDEQRLMPVFLKLVVSNTN